MKGSAIQNVQNIRMKAPEYRFYDGFYGHKISPFQFLLFGAHKFSNLYAPFVPLEVKAQIQ